MRKMRGYDREVPVELLRDYKLFAIACEGSKREPAYFRVFQHFSRRVTVDVIDEVVSDEEMESKHGLRSAPKWVLDRATTYAYREGLSYEDELWFVLDKDRWSFEQLEEIKHYCDEHPNWHIAISNPCFETWLYFHKKANFNQTTFQTCEQLKNEISGFVKGGYHELKFIGDLKVAIENARQADNQPDHFMPNAGSSKLYQLADNVMAFVGKNGFDTFINDVLPKLIQIQVQKYNKTKHAIRKRK